MIEKASNVDFLTGLHNVRHFDKTLNDYAITAKHTHTNISLLFIDVDYFKKVNDTYGHINGDIVLKGLSKLLVLLSRNDDVITRKGGEEFTVLLAKCGLEEAVAVAERIRAEIEKQVFISTAGENIKITVSVGVSSYPETTPDEDKLAEQADIALYKAKRTGRNKVCTAEPNSCRTDA
jgi:diguanylate cyclase